MIQAKLSFLLLSQGNKGGSVRKVKAREPFVFNLLSNTKKIAEGAWCLHPCLSKKNSKVKNLSQSWINWFV